MAADDSRFGVINTYYSHVSRLFVSNYATFFAVYLAFLALLYNASRADVAAKNWFFYASFMIMSFELVVLYRALQFGRVLNSIDELWARDGIIDVRERFWSRESRIGQLDRLYRAGSVPFAVILTFCIPMLSWFLLLRP